MDKKDFVQSQYETRNVQENWTNSANWTDIDQFGIKYTDVDGSNL